MTNPWISRELIRDTAFTWQIAFAPWKMEMSAFKQISMRLYLQMILNGVYNV